MTGALAGSMGSETICGEFGFLADAFGGGGGADGRLAIRGIPVEDTTKVVLTLTGSSLARAGALAAAFLAVTTLGAGKDLLAGGAVFTAILMTGFEPLAGGEVGVLLTTTKGSFFVAVFFVGAFFAARTDFLAGAADFFTGGFLAPAVVFLAGAIGFLALTGRWIAFLAFGTGFLVTGLAIFLTAAFAAFGTAVLAMTFFLIAAFGVALTVLVFDLDVLLLLTGFSSSICEVLASLSLRRPQCVLS